MSYKYILNEKNEPIPCINRSYWDAYMISVRRHVANDYINNYRISTIFLGYDHRFVDNGPPLLWETIIFKDGDPEERWRYSTYDDAKSGHEKALEWVKDQIKEDEKVCSICKK